MLDEIQNTDKVVFEKYIPKIIGTIINIPPVFEHEYTEKFVKMFISQIESLKNVQDENTEINKIQSEEFTLHFDNKENK